MNSPQDVLARAWDIYQNTFLTASQWREEFVQMGFCNFGYFNRIGLGYSDGSLFEMVAAQDLSRRSLSKMGILNDREETLKGLWIVPLLDERGQLINLAGFSLQNKECAKVVLTEENCFSIYNFSAMHVCEELLIVFDPFEAVCAIDMGFEQTMAICFSDKERAFVSFKKLLRAFSGEHVRIFFQDKHVSLIDQLQTFLSESRMEHKLSFIQMEQSFFELWQEEERELTLKKIDQMINFLDPKQKDFLENPLIEDRLNQSCLEVLRANRLYVIRGIDSGNNRLKVNIKCSYSDKLHGKFHIDTVDLYLARSRKIFIKDASWFLEQEFEVIENDLWCIVSRVEQFIDAKSNESYSDSSRSLSDSEYAQAVKFGQSKRLFQNILRDMKDCGYIGEETNKMMCYLAMTSRKLEDPLSIMVISASGAGKSSLQDMVLSFCPEEDLIKLTSITSKALFYKGQDSLAYKVLAIEEEAGAANASYAIRSLISSKILRIQATVRDQVTGKMTTMDHSVKGPTSVFKTTTQTDTDPETKSRFIVLSIDESSEQTRKILSYQRFMHTLEGLKAKLKHEAIIQKHKNFQRSLKKLTVINPYAEQLTFGPDRIQVRREHPKYLNIISSVAFLRQHQKMVQECDLGGHLISYIEVDFEDIRIAHELCHKVLGRAMDSLSESARELLLKINHYVHKRAKLEKKFICDVEFTRRELREYCSWSEFQLRMHIRQLVELEYLYLMRGKHGVKYVYRLASPSLSGFDGVFVPGLADVSDLKLDLNPSKTS